MTKKTKRKARRLYAAYGSNLHPVRLTERVPSARLLGKERLKNYSLQFHKISNDGSAKCNIVTDPGKCVHVAIFEMDTCDKPALDRVEGVGSGYTVCEMEIGGYGPCFLYIAERQYIDDSLQPYSWYRDLVILGCEYLRFPAAYVDSIRAISACLDEDLHRHTEHMQLLARAQQKS